MTDSIAVWNVRGLNNINKQVEVKSFIHSQNIKFMGLLETKVKAPSLGALYLNICPGWCITTNLAFHKGGRVMVIWHPSAYNVSIECVTEQFIHCKVFLVGRTDSFWCTFVYGFNDRSSREKLWNDLMSLNDAKTGPWMMLGDFNTVLESSERLGSVVREVETRPFRGCLQHCGMSYMRYKGRFYTWSNKQSGSDRVMSKIDRVLVNDEWILAYDHAEALFLPEDLFDHSPMKVNFFDASLQGKKPFRYYKMCESDPNYEEVVRNGWGRQVKGTQMFQIMHKMKLLKADFKALNQQGFSDIHALNYKALMEMQQDQNELHIDPGNANFAMKEKLALDTYRKVHANYIYFLKQKAKARWLVNGDENTHFFHQSIAKRRCHNRINMIQNAHQGWVTNTAGIQQVFVDYFSNFLGDATTDRSKVQGKLIKQGKTISDEHRLMLNLNFNTKEIKKAMLSIPGSKAPGIDGFNSDFLGPIGTLWGMM